MESKTFNDLNLPEQILRALTDMGFTEPTEIQTKAIPYVLDGKDVIGKSHTGTGKTVAFGVPAITSIEGSGTQVLILCPTRELAMQAEGELRKICKYIENIHVLAIYGGDPITGQIRQLKRGAEIVVGTPGRVMDHIRRNTLHLERLGMIVLDEADEMLNMGFREDIETILESIPVERQTVLFSATMPPEIMEITGQYQREPVLIEAGNTGERTINTVQQYYYQVPRGEKENALILLLHAHDPKLSIIFCNTKKMVDELGRCLSEHGFNVSALHGDMKQDMRTSVMNSFKSGRTPILIATDVAARGIDVDDVDAVYNFDIPQDFEYYIHRIGRTGRAGRSGAAYTLIDGPRQAMAVRSIERFIRVKIQHCELPDFDEITMQRGDRLVESIRVALTEHENKQWDENFQPSKMLEVLHKDGYTDQDIAIIALSQLLAREVENIPEVKIPKPVQPKPLTSLNEGNVRLRLSIGRNQRIAPNHIVGAIADYTGISGKLVGKIQCYGDYSLIEVPSHLAKRIIKEVSGETIGNYTADLRLYVEHDRGQYSSKRTDGRKMNSASKHRERVTFRKSYSRGKSN